MFLLLLIHFFIAILNIRSFLLNLPMILLINVNIILLCLIFVCFSRILNIVIQKIGVCIFLILIFCCTFQNILECVNFYFLSETYFEFNYLLILPYLYKAYSLIFIFFILSLFVLNFTDIYLKMKKDYFSRRDVNEEN